MKVMLTPDVVVAKVWDDYLHRFGAGEYVTARYLTPSTTMPMNEDALDDPPAGALLSPAQQLIRFKVWTTPSQPPVADQAIASSRRNAGSPYGSGSGVRHR